MATLSIVASTFTSTLSSWGKENEANSSGWGAQVEPGDQRALAHAHHLPAGLGGHRAVDGQASLVGEEGETFQIDDDASDLVAASTEPVRPRGEERQAGRVARAVAIQPTREGEELIAAMAKRAADIAVTRNE